MNERGGSPWKLLIILALIGALSVITSDDRLHVLFLMAIAYFSNASYSMVSRSGVRDSALYHAFTVLLNSVLFYLVLHELIKNDLNLVLFIPYTVATVYGSYTGAITSMRIEQFFGITVDISKKEPSKKSILARKILLSFLGIFGAVVAFQSDNIMASFIIAALMFGDGVFYSILRRSRNSSNTTYHIIASIVKSITWYLLYQKLSLSDMTFAFFLPYSFGSVLGGLVGQKTSELIERMIGSSTDAHLKSSSYNFIPWRAIAVLGAVGVLFVWFSGDKSFVAYLALLSAGQQIAFSIVSRSRNRNNMAYHIIASIFSNGIWFLTFRQLDVGNWTGELYLPFAIGAAIGSVTGVGISMAIEKKLNITSD